MRVMKYLGSLIPNFIDQGNKTPQNEILHFFSSSKINSFDDL